MYLLSNFKFIQCGIQFLWGKNRDTFHNMEADKTVVLF